MLLFLYVINKVFNNEVCTYCIETFNIGIANVFHILTFVSCSNIVRGTWQVLLQ